MAREIFVDASAWLALSDPDDTFYAAATLAARTRLRDWPYQVTTNLAVAEAYTLIRYRVGYSASMRFLQLVHNTPRLISVQSDPILEKDAEEILRRYTDQPFSYTDAVSFALMRQRGIIEAFAFDHHFLTAGFLLVPTAPR